MSRHVGERFGGKGEGVDLRELRIQVDVVHGPLGVHQGLVHRGTQVVQNTRVRQQGPVDTARVDPRRLQQRLQTLLGKILNFEKKTGYLYSRICLVGRLSNRTILPKIGLIGQLENSG